ncbi:MAG: hypothetical protein IT371_30285 [Deltaproteobacteria bacterium]|nr:hypothetical protein [Deltaproteobacteria bacterium]
MTVYPDCVGVLGNDLCKWEQRARRCSHGIVQNYELRWRRWGARRQRRAATGSGGGGLGESLIRRARDWARWRSL